MTSNKPFQIELTHSELRWLAEVLGYVQFPLLGIPKKNESASDLESELKMAQAKMQERGLVAHLPGAGWQVERLVIAITQIIANPSSIQMLQIWEKDGTTKRAFAYSNLDISLFVEETSTLEFTLHSGMSSLTAQKQVFFKLPAKAAIAQVSIQIDHPEQIVQMIWNSSEEIAIKKMMEAVSDNQQASKLAKALNQITNVGMLTDGRSTAGGFDIVGQQCLIWNKKNIWRGAVKEEGISDFVPVSYDQALNLFNMNI